MNSSCDASATSADVRDISTKHSVSLKDIQCAASNSWPKLGDFRKLYRDNPASCSSEDGHIKTLTHDASRKCLDLSIETSEAAFGTDIKLGDFRKVRQELRQQHFELSPHAITSGNEFPEKSQTVVNGKENYEEQASLQWYGDVLHMQPTSPNLRSNQPILRLPTSPLKDCVDDNHNLKSALPEPHVYANENCLKSEWDAVEPPCFERPETMPTTDILSNKGAAQGLVLPVLGQKPSLNQKHEALSMRLVPIKVGDISIVADNRSVALNGVHIFLDMSNINISFQRALRHKYSNKEHFRLFPLPQLNLQFLTEILVRDRRTIALNAGCSVLPDRQKPRFIQELRKLGYRVDLRERRLITETRGRYLKMSKGRGGESSDKLVALHTVARFIEDLVDETLQTRIAESVMEYFEHPGTLVLATGDAQPAKYSDGFFTYAERALRMGWYVEVVSWNISLSSRWQKSNLTQKWGDRFRLIRLDDFLDELLL
ncbi:hypothetical protein E4U41_000110 [Claviceps citrina]|nr:hypothetical protein E4U41_000110 [Claviceps citrina]